MARILSVGADESLMATRKMILEGAGHTVLNALTVSAVEEACSSASFQVAIIGQNLIPSEKQRAFDLIRERCPTAKVLCLYNSAFGRVLPKADDWLEVPAKAPGELAEHVNELAG